MAQASLDTSARRVVVARLLGVDVGVPDEHDDVVTPRFDVFIEAASGTVA